MKFEAYFAHSPKSFWDFVPSRSEALSVDLAGGPVSLRFPGPTTNPPHITLTPSCRVHPHWWSFAVLRPATSGSRSALRTPLMSVFCCRSSAAEPSLQLNVKVVTNFWSRTPAEPSRAVSAACWFFVSPKITTKRPPRRRVLVQPITNIILLSVSCFLCYRKLPALCFHAYRTSNFFSSNYRGYKAAVKVQAVVLQRL